MARYRSPYFDNLAFESIASNIASIFRDPNPASSAQARLFNIKARDAQRSFDARRAFADRMRGRTGPITAGEFGPDYADAVLFGENPDWTNTRIMGYQSNVGAPDSTIARAVVGAKGGIGQNQGVSLGDREAVAKRENDAAMARTATSAGIAANASMRNQDVRLNWERERFKLAPQSDVGKVFFDRDRPGVSEDDRALYAEAGKRKAGGSPQPMTITPKVIDDIEGGVLSEIGAATIYRDGGVEVAPEFMERYAAQRENARRALAMALRMGRNAQEAREAYMRELGIEPGVKFGTEGFDGGVAGSVVGRAFGGGGSPRIVSPVPDRQPSGPAPAPSPPSAGAPRAGATPPVERLKEGVETTFANGQTWTLRNGQPLRVR